jgi:hypothetical protein
MLKCIDFLYALFSSLAVGAHPFSSTRHDILLHSTTALSSRQAGFYFYQNEKSFFCLCVCLDIINAASSFSSSSSPPGSA